MWGQWDKYGAWGREALGPSPGTRKHRSGELRKAVPLSTGHSTPHGPCRSGLALPILLGRQVSPPWAYLTSDTGACQILKTAEWALDPKAPYLTAGSFSSVQLQMVHFLLPKNTAIFLNHFCISRQCIITMLGLKKNKLWPATLPKITEHAIS